MKIKKRKTTIVILAAFISLILITGITASIQEFVSPENIMMNIIEVSIFLSLFLIAMTYNYRGSLELKHDDLIINPPFGKTKKIKLKNITQITYEKPKTITYLLNNLFAYQYKLSIHTQNDKHIIRVIYMYKNYAKFLKQLEIKTKKEIQGKEILKKLL